MARDRVEDAAGMVAQMGRAMDSFGGSTGEVKGGGGGFNLDYDAPGTC